MSGGHYDYFYRKMEDIADELSQNKDPLRRAFAGKLKLFAKAMHDIEWVDSGDYGDGDEIEAINLALGGGADALTLKEIILSAREIKEQLTRYINDLG